MNSCSSNARYSSSSNNGMSPVPGIRLPNWRNTHAIALLHTCHGKA
jgi:hypothetical protein